MDREQIRKRFDDENFFYAKIIKEIPIGDGQNFSYFFVWDNNGTIEEIEVTKTEKDNLVDKNEATTETMKKIIEEVGQDYPFDHVNTFKTLCNKFKYEGVLLRYDNKLNQDKLVTIESHRQRDFDLQFFLTGKKTETLKKNDSKKEIPIIEGLQGFSLQRICLNKQQLSPEMIEKLKEAGAKLNKIKKEISLDFEKDKNIENYNEKFEDAMQEFSLIQMEVNKDKKYKWESKVCFTQADYVCGNLICDKHGESKLVNWFIISRGFRNFISQLKYPERYDGNFTKFRKCQNSGITEEYNFLNSEKKKWEYFDVDLRDILSGNQNTVCNTYRKFNLLNNEYKIKKTPKEFWKKIQRKLQNEQSKLSFVISKEFFGKTDDSILNESFEIDDDTILKIGEKYFPNDSKLFSAKDDMNEKFFDIYRNLRTEQFSIERCHTINALFLFVIYGKKIFRENGIPLMQIIYKDAFIHSEWDIHEWLKDTLTDKNDFSEGRNKIDWCYF